VSRSDNRNAWSAEYGHISAHSQNNRVTSYCAQCGRILVVVIGYVLYVQPRCIFNLARYGIFQFLGRIQKFDGGGDISELCD